LRASTLGGALYIAATFQYAVAQIVVAASWNPPYDWFDNYISDLGNTACGMFAVPHATPAFVCSPLHAVMNASFVLSGLLVIACTGLLWGAWPGRKMMAGSQVLWIVAGLGKLGVGLAPENRNIALHTVAALNIPVGSAAVLLLSLAILRQRRALALVGLGLFAMALIGTVSSIAAQFAGPALLFGLGVGGMERLASYPANVWLVALGSIAILERLPRGIRAARSG
jgi:hypothetical membrane protein